MIRFLYVFFIVLFIGSSFLRAESYTITFDNKDLDFYSSFIWKNDYNIRPIESKYDFGLSIFYKKGLMFETSSRYSELAYNFFPEKRVRFFTGFQYNYKYHVVLPLGVNLDVGDVFGIDKNRLILSSKVGFNVTQVVSNDIKEVKNNFDAAFIIRFRFF
jgi:hypothetical protein